MNKNVKSKITAVCFILLILLMIFFRLPKKFHKELPHLDFGYLTDHVALNLFVLPEYEPKIFAQLPKAPEPIESDKTIVKEDMQMLIDEYNNEDFVGWLKIEDSSINYPVFQSDDNEYYLHRDSNKNHSSAGSIYMDYENDITQADRNIIIYGHNMNADTMFHSLRYYKDYSYYENHKYIELKTLYDTYIYEVFAFYDTHISFEYITVFFKDDTHFQEMLDTMKEKSLYDTGVEVTAADRIISLSTCTNINADDRYVLNGKLISINGKSVEEYENALAEYTAELIEYEHFIGN